MTTFILGLILFFATHFFTAVMRPQRQALVAKLGEMPFKGLFGIISIIGFVLIVLGWPQADATSLYLPPDFLRHATYALMLISIILLVAAYAPAGRIAPAVQHPMLAGVKVWAFAHLLSNGEVRSVLLFGSFLAFAIVDRIAVKKRKVSVRARGPVRNDILVIIIGIVVYLIIAHYLHQYIAGVDLY